MGQTLTQAIEYTQLLKTFGPKLGNRNNIKTMGKRQSMTANNTTCIKGKVYSAMLPSALHDKRILSMLLVS